jgi:hypothetical protein
MLRASVLSQTRRTKAGDFIAIDHALTIIIVFQSLLKISNNDCSSDFLEPIKTDSRLIMV